MDATKCRELKAALEAMGDPPIVAAERFFDGNDDLGSIGCNLPEHPGIDAFRDAFARLAGRPDVRSVHMVISEIDPGDDCWPFSDLVLVAGDLSEGDLQQALAKLGPDEVGRIGGGAYGLSDDLLAKLGSPALAAWWD